MEILSHTIIFLLLATVWHFVYEGVIAPTARFHLRNELFALRDGVRYQMVSKNLKDFERESVLFFHDGISQCIHFLSELNIVMLFETNKILVRDNTFKKEVEKRSKALEKIENTNIVEALKKANSLVRKAILWNSGSWIIYILPIAICLWYYEILKRLSSQILSMPPDKGHLFFPERAI